MADEGENAEPSLIDRFAKKVGLKPSAFMTALRRVCGTVEGVTDADFMILLLTAEKYGLDPIRREIGLMATKRGLQPYVSFDAWVKVVTSHSDYIAHDVEEVVGDGRVVAARCLLYTRTRKAEGLPPFGHIEWMDECYVPPRKSKDGYEVKGPWQSHPRRMLKEKALSQAARFLWNLYVPTADEFLREEDMVQESYGTRVTTVQPESVQPVMALPTPVSSEQIAVATSAEPVAVVAAPGPGDAPAARATAPATGRSSRRKPVQQSLIPDEAPPPKSPSLPSFDPEESRALDRRTAEEQKKAEGSMFDDIDL